MGNKNVPFGMAVGLIVLVAGIALAGIYCQSISAPDVAPVAVPVAKQQAVPEETVTTKTFRNDTYGLEFTYSPEWGNVDGSKENSVEQFFISRNDNWVFQLSTQMENPGENDFYNIPTGTAVDEWIIRKQGKVYADEGDGYFSNKVGSGFDIAGLKTLHLVSRQQQGGSYDEFSFVKDGQLYVLTIVSDPSMREDLKLDDDSQWYTQLLKSFKVVTVQD
jgi:hypothetical protein